MSAKSKDRHKNRVGKVFIGAHFDMWVRRELHLIAAQEGIQIQDLLGEAIAAVLIARTPEIQNAAC